MLESVNDWTLSLENSKLTDVAYVDFAKAFERVVHSKLLSNLPSYGISGNQYLWIGDFLSDITLFCC